MRSRSLQPLPLHLFFQPRPHIFKIIFRNAALLHIHMPAHKHDTFGFKLFPLNIAPAKGKAPRTESPCVHHAVAGRNGITRIFVKRVPHIAAQIAVPRERGNLRVRGDLPARNQAHGGVDFFCKRGSVRLSARHFHPSHTFCCIPEVASVFPFRQTGSASSFA